MIVMMPTIRISLSWLSAQAWFGRQNDRTVDFPNLDGQGAGWQGGQEEDGGSDGHCQGGHGGQDRRGCHGCHGGHAGVTPQITGSSGSYVFFQLNVFTIILIITKATEEDWWQI